MGKSAEYLVSKIRSFYKEDGKYSLVFQFTFFIFFAITPFFGGIIAGVVSCNDKLSSCHTSRDSFFLLMNLRTIFLVL